VDWFHLAWDRVEWRDGVSWPPKQVPVMACQEEYGTCSQTICHKTDSKLNSKHAPLVKLKCYVRFVLAKRRLQNTVQPTEFESCAGKTGNFGD
jgi:hypothetical protein